MRGEAPAAGGNAAEPHRLTVDRLTVDRLTVDRLTVDRLTVALVDTSSSELGSMREYVELVEEALSGPSLRPPLRVVRVDLALPPRLVAWIPRWLQAWANVGYVTWAARRLRHVRADVVHIADGSHSYVMRACGGRPVVVTVHDMIPHLRLLGRFGVPRASPLARYRLSRTVVALKAASRLITVSATTADDLALIARTPISRMRVVPIALTRTARALLASSPVDWVARRAEDPYVLHVGNNGFYKNRVGVLRVFARVAERSEARMVMAGAEPTPQLRELVEALGLHGRVSFVVEPTNEAIASLYRGACVLLFPSLYEGFGLPILEAMAAGCPVVCSRTGSLPEVAGDAALTASPHNEDDLAGAVLRVLATPDLAAILIETGRARAATYTLPAMAAGILEVYLGALGETRGGRR
jgi:glycosyltransferase involved in cell wall biosynthesis